MVVGLARLGLEPMIYRTRGEHTNLYTTDVVEDFNIKTVLYMFVKGDRISRTE